MPATILVQMLVELVGSLLIEAVAAGVGGAAEKTGEAIEDYKARKRERALACVDLLVLAAYHDFVITEAERAVLAEACSEILGKVDLEADVDELLVRWSEPRTALPSEDHYRTLVRDTATKVEDSDKERVLAAVERMVEAEIRRPAAFRDRAPGSGQQTLALFRELLARA